VRSDEVIDVRQDFLEWSEPIIADYLYDAYASHLGAGSKVLRTIATSHARFWRSMLAGTDSILMSQRREVQALIRLAGLPATLADTVDVGVLDELMNVILARFLRSPPAARDYSHHMLRIAASLSRAHTTAS
jgi:hypothetical protein